VRKVLSYTHIYLKCCFDAWNSSKVREICCHIRDFLFSFLEYLRWQYCSPVVNVEFGFQVVTSFYSVNCVVFIDFIKHDVHKNTFFTTKSQKYVYLCMYKHMYNYQESL
jgi:hypothetical protein